MQKFNFVILSLLYSISDAFTGPSSRILQTRLNIPQISSETKLNVKSPPDQEVQTISRPITNDEEERLGKTFGGYTVKQRLREEVESPFRKVRFIFFLSSAGSAGIALYFSALSLLKANMGGYSDAMPLDDALTNCAINLGGVAVCGYLAFRDYKTGQANLERIAKGGRLARLAITPASKEQERSVKTLSEYRRSLRIVIAAGGKEYIETMNRSLNSDQLKDTNNPPSLLEEVDVLVIPVLLTGSKQSGIVVADTKNCWRETEPQELDRNYDSSRSDDVVGFPRGNAAWDEYLKSEIDTAASQGFDVVEKGFTITVKKNGKILRRATGQPRWGDLIGAMEVLDGSKFGMPGDTERYGA